MAKVTIKNVTKSKSILSCDLSDKSSLILLYGESRTLDDSLITDYLRRRASAGDYKITPVKEVIKKDRVKTKPSTEVEENKKEVE